MPPHPPIYAWAFGPNLYITSPLHVLFPSYPSAIYYLRPSNTGCMQLCPTSTGCI